MSKNLTVISLGGSLVFPKDGLDVPFVKGFVDLIKRRVNNGEKFAIITGGGTMSREYQTALKEISKNSEEELDWMGIYATRMNAEFVRLSFGELADEQIIPEPFGFKEIKKGVAVGGGFKPGRSSDFSAVVIAENIGAKKVINLSNIDYVYDSDPKVNPDAKKVEKISWSDFLAILPPTWTPGANVPFDPVAAKRAENAKLQVIIMNGKNLTNLESCLDGREFAGTTVI
ncbi:MAG: UMP kinase [bacterium]|nr:UMP kinase [bacterium]